MRLKYIFLLFLFFLFCNSINAQNEVIDSLNILIKKDAEDTNKINHLRSLARAYAVIGELNTCALKCKEGIQLAEKLNYKLGLGRLYNRLGNCYTEQGNYSEALKILLQGLKIKKEINDKDGLCDNYLFLGNYFLYQSNLDEALNYFNLSLKTSQEIKKKSLASQAYSGQAVVYQAQGKNEEALKMHFECLKLIEKDSANIPTEYMQIGYTYWALGQKHEAEKYFLATRDFCIRRNDKHHESFALLNLSNLYMEMGKVKEAFDAINKVISKSKEIGSKELLRDGYYQLTYIDSVNGNYKAAFEHHKLFIAYRDSITNIESQKSIIEQQAKHEFEKKEELIKLEQTKKEAVAKSEKQKQQIILISVVIGLIFLILFSIFLYKRYKQAQQQKSIIEKQKHLIEEHQKETIDSITYAKRIQDAILPPIDLIKTKLPNSFVLFKPKDIVAGDFYWMESITLRNESDSVQEEIILIAAADCTGHGVPGAMVSVVCSNALNRAVKEFKLAETGAILDKVTDLVLETFEKSSTEVKDGMDISLLSINKTTKQVQWSGANNPLWYFENKELKEIKADKQPIGKSDHRKMFTTHTIDYKTNSTFYLFTDGYADQFGGPKGKKFKYKQFQETLSGILNKEPVEQSHELQIAFENWKGNLEQIDDVCVIGIQL